MSIFSSVKEKITQHLDVYIKLIKLDFIGRTAKLLSYFMFAMICLLLVLCIFLFLGFGMSETFVTWGMPKFAAFFTTLGIYVVLLAVIIGLRKNITRFFAGGFIQALTEEDEDNEEKK